MARLPCRNVVYPLPPAFRESANGGSSLDLPQTTAYVRYLYENGARVFMTTCGTSQYNLLTGDEILDFNTTISRDLPPGASLIAGLPVASQDELLGKWIPSFNRLNVRALLALFPERYYSEREVLDFFGALATASNEELWIHGIPFTDRSHERRVFSPSLISKLKEIPNIGGLKEESLSNLNMAYEVAREATSNFSVVVAGGSARRFLLTHGYAQSYLAGIGSFFPQIEEAIFSYMQAGEVVKAQKIIQKYEDPLFDLSGQLGWHVLMRHGLAALGYLPSLNRAPFPRFDSEVARTVHGKLIDMKQAWGNETHE